MEFSEDIPVRCDNEDVPVDSQVFPIAAADVQAYSSSRASPQKVVHNWPRLKKKLVNRRPSLSGVVQTLYLVEEK